MDVAGTNETAIASPAPTSGKLAIGFAACGGLAVVWAAVQALRLFQADVADRLALVALGDPVDGTDARAVREFTASLPGLHHVALPDDEPASFAALARAVDADILCLLDPYVMLAPGALAALLAWFDAHPACDTLVQASPGAEAGTVAFRTVVASARFCAAGGEWRGESPQAYLASSTLVACRRAAWPLIAARLAQDHTADAAADRAAPEAQAAEVPAFAWQELRHRERNPFDFFPAIFCLNLDSATDRWQTATRHFRRLGIARRVERFSAVPTPENHHRGCTLSWRLMIAEAQRRGLASLLVFEDDVLFLDTTRDVLRAAVSALAAQEWDCFYLGAVGDDGTFPYVAGSEALRVCGPVTTTHALAVHARAFDRILADIPEERGELDAWLAEWLAIDQYLWRKIAVGAFRTFIAAPRVASQPALLNYADADLALAQRFVR